jgi:hypothetical protein
MRFLQLVGAAAAAIVCSAAALAQPVRLPGAVEPGRERPTFTPTVPDSDVDLTIQSPRRR